MTQYHIITMNYNAERTFFNRDSYNPYRKHKIVIFGSRLEETESSYKFIKDDGREKTLIKSFVVAITIGKIPDNCSSFELDVDEGF